MAEGALVEGQAEAWLVGDLQVPSTKAGVSSQSRSDQGMYSTVRPLGMEAMSWMWISGTRWLTTGRLKASAMAATLRQGVMPPTRSRSIITMSTERFSINWRRG